jgi:hypothetical protein
MRESSLDAWRVDMVEPRVMNLVVVVFILFGVFPFLFPEACRSWLERAQGWLTADEPQQKRTWRAERAVEEETREWMRWVRQGKRTLPRVKSEVERVLLLAQLQAAGERFLAGLSQSAEGKPAHPAIETVAQKTTALLELLDAEHKKRGEASRPRPSTASG